MTKSSRASLLVFALVVGIIIWAYTHRDVEVHATVTVPEDEIVIGHGSSSSSSPDAPVTYD